MHYYYMCSCCVKPEIDRSLKNGSSALNSGTKGSAGRCSQSGRNRLLSSIGYEKLDGYWSFAHQPIETYGCTDIIRENLGFACGGTAGGAVTHPLYRPAPGARGYV